ncbi:MAG: hypothetical protein R3B06_23750 [Kofleriaceae bacterium]
MVVRSALRAIHRTLVVLVVLAVGVVTVPRALAAATIVCCCGEHDAAHACGCPDCPAGHHGDDQRGPAGPSVKACGGQGVDVALATVDLAPPPVAVSLTVIVASAIAGPVAGVASRLPEPPAPPPPRR